MPHWTYTYFDSGYLRRWGLGPPTAKHRDEARWILEQLRPKVRRAPLVDVACGHGAYSVALAAEGFRILGLDRSDPLLQRAAGIASDAAAAVDWVRADYRFLPLASAVAAGGFLRDAFGFYDDEIQNLAVLREIRRTLSRQSGLVLAVVNAVPIRDHFQPEAEELQGDLRIRIRRQLLTEPLRQIERLELEESGAVTVHERRQRLYTSEELGALLTQAGFEVIALYGDCVGAPFVESSSGKSVFVAIA